jgi:serine/threonine-protein kinase LATS1/2
MMPMYERPSKNTSARVTPSNEFSDSGIEEETTPRRTPVPPEAFKFFMEQHVENIFKSYHQRMQRRLKLEQEMAKRGLDEPTSEQMRRILYQKESNFLRIKRAKMHKDMFKTVKPLGIGAFGVVSLVRKVDTNKLYAMKTLRKADVLRRNQVAHVKAERDILAEADNEWVVKLFFSFQDSENLYFVMEYIPGGDMMSLLIKLGTFPEHLTLFYVAELVCAIESVHKMGFIHRDIKPDNILIGGDGHIKLTDFGLCTGFRWTHDSKRYLPKGHHQRHHSMEPGQWDDDEPVKPLEVRRVQHLDHDRSIAHSLVGTPNYIAPEILRRVGYKQLCDWWSVGVIMYEMIVGQPPFMAPTPSETQHKIMNWSQYLHIPQHAIMSRAAADLILRFCCDPSDRIGKNGAIEIKSHPFFSAIDWSVGIRNYEPPYVPKIMYDADTSNFDPISQSQLQKLQSKKQQDVSSLPKGQPEHAFYEWTFIRFYPEKGVGQKRPQITPSSVYTGSPGSSSASQNPSYSSPPPPPPSGYDRTRRATERPAPPATTGNTSSPSPIPSANRDRRKPTPQPVYV